MLCRNGDFGIIDHHQTIGHDTVDFTGIVIKLKSPIRQPWTFYDNSSFFAEFTNGAIEIGLIFGEFSAGKAPNSILFEHEDFAFGTENADSRGGNDIFRRIFQV